MTTEALPVQRKDIPAAVGIIAALAISAGPWSAIAVLLHVLG